MSSNELMIKGGRVVDPGSGHDQIMDIAFSDGLISAIAPELPVRTGVSVLDATGKVVTPGLIDLHTHIYYGATSLSVEAEPVARVGGTATFVDAGSAGSGNFIGLKKFIMDQTPLRVLSFLNISFPGIFGFSEYAMVGECADIRLLDIKSCVKTIMENPEYIKGIKVRVGQLAGGDQGLLPLKMALDVAQQTGVPIMCHIDGPPPSLDDVLEILRPGDVLTHCFRSNPNAPVHDATSIRQSVQAARQRGVYFDIGHGCGSLSFEVSRVMLDHDFKPDTISSDVHMLSINGPAYHLLETLSKFLCLGMDLNDVIRAATQTPAKILNSPELGQFSIGSPGDASILNLQKGAFDYVDSTGKVMVGDKRLTCEALVIGGEVWHQAEEK